MSLGFNIIEFFKQVQTEFKKIVWPTQREATVSMISVCIMVLFFSVLLFLIDKIVETGVWAFVLFFEKIFA